MSDNSSEIEWLRAENSRLWAALNAAGKAAGRLVFTEASIVGSTLHLAVLVSDDEEGNEEGAHHIVRIVRAAFGDEVKS